MVASESGRRETYPVASSDIAAPPPGGASGHPPPAGGGAGAGSRRAAALEAQALGGHARACARGKQTARRKGDRRVF